MICTCMRIVQRYDIISLLTDAACCPDINIEDVMLLNKTGEIAENTAYTQSFLVYDSKSSDFSGFLF